MQLRRRRRVQKRTKLLNRQKKYPKKRRQRIKKQKGKGLFTTFNDNMKALFGL